MPKSQYGFVRKDTKDTVYTPDWGKIYDRTGGLVKVKEKLEKYDLEKGLKDPTDSSKFIMEEKDLRKIYKLILEIRYLENNGNATIECGYEKDEGGRHYVKDLIGVIGIGTGEGDLDKKFRGYGEEGEYYLVGYFRGFSWNQTTGEVDAELGIKNVRDGKDDYLEGFDTKDKFELYLDDYERYSQRLGTNDWNKEVIRLIRKELGKDNPENAQVWTDKLKTIDTLGGLIITEAERNEWVNLPKKKFEKVAQVEALIKKVIGSDDKVDSKFLAAARKKKDALTSLGLVLKEKPKEVIGLIARYEYDKLDDSASEEKDKKQTQQKRRIAKKLKKTKESELTDPELEKALTEIKTGELVFTTDELAKTYTADLKEITTEGPKEEKDPKKEPSFLRLNNPWVWVIAAILIGTICAIVWWDKIKGLFGKNETDEN
jgi:hypothetical protein